MSKLVSVIATAAALFAATPGQAQDAYPSHPIKIIVCLPAGGGVDTVTRIIADKMSKILGQPVVVENKGGQSGNLGAEFVYTAEPDGYTLLASQPAPITTSPLLFKKLNFDPTRFEPVAVMSAIANTLLVRPDFPANNVKEFIAYAKANPGKLVYGSAGTGSMTHLAGELFKSLAGVPDIIHVPYKGSGASLTDVISGQVLELHKSGKLRMLVVTSPERIVTDKEIPTAEEAGLAGMVSVNFTGLFAPAKTPKPIIEQIAAANRKAMDDEEVRKNLIEQGMEPYRDSTPEKTARFVAEDIARWTPVIRSIGLKLN